MSENMEDVKAAAAMLDELCEYKDWRDMIDLVRLNMDSTRYCILGQIYGHWSIGKDVLSTWIDSHEDAFCGYAAEWKEYLSTPIVDMVGPYDNTPWMGKSSDWVRVTARQSLVIDEKTYVAFTQESDGRSFMHPEAHFLEWYEAVPPKPKYVIGRLYLSADKSTVFLFNGENYPQFHRLNSNSRHSDAGQGDVTYYEETYGPLTEAHVAHSINKDKVLSVTFEDE